MQWFKCRIRGVHFPGGIAGQRNEFGFYATRFVQADTAVEAELKALDNFRKEPKLKLPKGVTPSARTRVFFEEVTEVHANDANPRAKGYTFFAMEPHNAPDNGG